MADLANSPTERVAPFPDTPARLVSPGAANFVFFDPGMEHEVCKCRMSAKGVDTARAFPPRRDWARVTMGTTEEMKVFAKVLREVLAGQIPSVGKL